MENKIGDKPRRPSEDRSGARGSENTSSKNTSSKDTVSSNTGSNNKGASDRDASSLTQWLRDSRDGEALIAPEIHDFVCDRLNAIARRVRKGWPRGGTLDTHGLVQEFFLRYLKAKNIYVEDRRHFFNLAATMMRQIFINSARYKNAGKRGGGVPDVELEDYMLMDLQSPESVLLVDQLLQKLELQRPLSARAFVQKHYAHLTVAEISEALEVSESSVKRHLKFANGFLMRHMMADTN